jgi:hypothetical protein
MKSLLFLSIIVVAGICSPTLCRAEDPLEFSFYLVDHEGSNWQLLRFAEKLVFLSVKPRPKPNNNLAKLEGAGIGTVAIEPAIGGPPVPLRRNHTIEDLVAGGPYALSIQKLLDRPKVYLTADYSTDPPTVRLEKAPGKEGRWEFVDAGKFSQAFIKHVQAADKPAWLSLAESGTILPVNLQNAQDMIVEVRDVILTPERKQAVRIKRHTESK